MANGAGRLFDVMKKTGEASKGVSSKLVSLKVKSKEPLIFQIDDRLEITEEFCYFSNSADKELLDIGDIVVAVALNNGQSYYIQHNLDGLLTTVAELNFLQGATDNIQNQIDEIKTSGVATGDTLPIGSVVEFTGDTVPENWEEVEYNECIVKDVEPTTGQDIWLQKTKNLFNKDARTLKVYIAGDGTLVSNGVWSISHYIAVLPNKKYTYQGLSTPGNTPKGAYYDENKNFLWAFTQLSGINVITIPERARYVRFSINQDVSDYNTFQIEKGSVGTAYSPYIKSKIHIQNDDIYEEFDLSEVEVSSTEPMNDKKVWLEKGRNLLDINRRFEFGWYDMNNKQVSYSVSNAIFGYIAVSPSTVYTLSTDKAVRSLAFAFFDKDKKPIGVREVLDTTSNTVTTSSNCYYVRIWLNYKEGTTITASIIRGVKPQLEIGNSRTYYEPYKRILHVKNENSDYEEFDMRPDIICIGSQVIHSGVSGTGVKAKTFLIEHYDYDLITITGSVVPTPYGYHKEYTLSFTGHTTDVNTLKIYLNDVEMCSLNTWGPPHFKRTAVSKLFKPENIPLATSVTNANKQALKLYYENVGGYAYEAIDITVNAYLVKDSV